VRAHETQAFGVITAARERTAYGSRAPWDTEARHGGSSGAAGEAGTVAGGMFPRPRPTRGGGSIRIPRFLLRPGRAEAEAADRVPVSPQSWLGAVVEVLSLQTRSPTRGGAGGAVLDAISGPDCLAGTSAVPGGRSRRRSGQARQLRIGLMASARWHADRPACKGRRQPVRRALQELGQAVRRSRSAIRRDGPAFIVRPRAGSRTTDGRRSGSSRT